MQNKVDQKMITKMILEEIKNKNIPLNIEAPQLPPIQPIEVKREKTYESAPVSVFDAFTLILFTLNLIGVMNINWFVVFLPMTVPYIFLGIAFLVSKLIIKIKEKKNINDKTN